MIFLFCSKWDDFIIDKIDETKKIIKNKNEVYSYLLFVYSDMPGKDLQQYLEIKLTRSTGASVIKKPFIQYIRAGSRGRCLYLRVPVASVNKIDELVNMIMIEANTSYLTVCEPITETR